MIYYVVRCQSLLTADCDLDTFVYRIIWTHVHGATPVVLDDLVARLVCAAADNPGFLASCIPFLRIWLGTGFL